MDKEIRNNEVAWVGKIIHIMEIPKADFLVSAVADCEVGGVWTGVVGKGE